MKNLGALILLSIALIIEIIVLAYVKKHSLKSHRQLIKAFMAIVICMMCWCAGLIVQIFVINFISDEYAIYVDYFVYPFIATFPAILFLFTYIFKNEHITFKRKYLLLFVIPFISMLVLWTNDFHHLFYENYSTNISLTKFGPYYYYVYIIHNYMLLAFDLFLLVKTSVKKTSLLSLQTLLIFASAMIPLGINFVISFNLIPSNIYATPISFSVSVILLRNCYI